MGLYDFTIYDIICRNAHVYADRDCIIFNDTRLNYRAYKERCDRLAAGLMLSGIKKGDRLGVIAHNCDEFLILYGAAAKIGAIILPVNWRLQPKEVEYVLNDCAPKAVFVGLDHLAAFVETAGNIKSIEKYYTIGHGERADGFLPFEDLYAEEKDKKEIDIPLDSGFVIIHTAGQDGRPRGALLSQKNIVLGNFPTMLQFGLGPTDSHICILPLFHIAGLSLALAVMHGGGKNVIVDRFDAARTLKLIEKEQGTIFYQFPPILKMITEKYRECPCDISSIRNVGGLDSQENIRAFLKIAPKARFWTGYGQTEVMGVSLSPTDEKPGSAGMVSSLARVAILDDHDYEVPTGTHGEICVRSPTVFLGYWHRENETAYTFRNGWHHTGDIGYLDADGSLWYVKRKPEKELIKPGGENVYPVEVEKAILDHEAVAEASVIGVQDPQWGEAIKAVCVLKSGSDLDSQELIEFVASKISGYKKPKHVIFVDALPKTPEGEIDREQIKREHGGNTDKLKI